MWRLETQLWLKGLVATFLTHHRYFRCSSSDGIKALVCLWSPCPSAPSLIWQTVPCVILCVSWCTSPKQALSKTLVTMTAQLAWINKGTNVLGNMVPALKIFSINITQLQPIVRFFGDHRYRCTLIFFFLTSACCLLNRHLFTWRKPWTAHTLTLFTV